MFIFRISYFYLLLYICEFNHLYKFVSTLAQLQMILVQMMVPFFLFSFFWQIAFCKFGK